MSFMTNSLKVWGHRGHRHHRYAGFSQPAHENSLKAYEQVLQATTGLECDVVQSLQNTPFLVHDTLFNGIAKYELKSQLDEPSQQIVKDRYIFQLGNEELENLRLKDGQTIPRLSHLLKLMPDFTDRVLTLELKGPNVADSTLKTVENAIHKKFIQPAQIIFASYNLPTLHDLRLNTGRRFKISVMLTPADLQLAQMYPNWPNAEQNAYYVPFSMQALQRADIRTIDPDFLHIEARSLTAETLETIHESIPNSRVILWCAGEKHPDINRFFVDKITQFSGSKTIFAVISDFPEAVQKELIGQGIDIAKPENPYRL